MNVRLGNQENTTKEILFGLYYRFRITIKNVSSKSIIDVKLYWSLMYGYVYRTAIKLERTRLHVSSSGRTGPHCNVVKMCVVALCAFCHCVAVADASSAAPA